MDKRVKAASLSVTSNTVLLTVKLISGILTGSVSIISAAADSINDLASSIIAFFSVRAAVLPADKQHPYGHGKIENVSSALQALLIFGAGVYIVYEAVKKIVEPEPLETISLGIAVMAFTAIVDLFVSRYLLKVADETDSAAIRGDAYHLTTDVWTSVAVLGGLVLVWITGVTYLDPIIALAISVMVFRVAFSLASDAFHKLVDVALPFEEVKRLEEIVMRSPKVVGYHKLRTRKSGRNREIDYHLILPANMPLQEAHQLAEDIEDKMKEILPHTTVVTHIEPDTAEELMKPDTEIKKRRTPRRTRQGPTTRRPPQSGA